MLRKLSDWLYRVSTGRLALGSLALMLLFMALVMPGESAKAAAYSAGAGTPDTTFIYSLDKLLGMAQAYGEQGRQAYIHARFTFDLAFPLVYGFFLTACSSWLLARWLAPASPWRRLNLLPLAAVLFDLLENASAALVMSAYPSIPLLAARLAMVFTPVKWLFVTAGFTLLGVTGLGAILHGRPKTDDR
ncbi:MAG: hypothetical protein PWQ55_600 [Chloroflexota bacterium]|nr:hypothetical protein [Chloroflexota bacterium]